MKTALGSILTVGLLSLWNVAEARFIQGDPLGAVPAMSASAVPIPNAPNPPMLTTPRVATAIDVLGFHALNHSYTYVRSDPLRYTDPHGLEPVGTIPSDPAQAAVFYNWPSRMRPPSGGCVVDCILKRQAACMPIRVAGMLTGLSVAAAGSFASGGADFPVLAPPAVFIGGNAGAAICNMAFFEQSCQQECSSCRP